MGLTIYGFFKGINAALSDAFGRMEEFSEMNEFFIDYWEQVWGW